MPVRKLPGVEALKRLKIGQQRTVLPTQAAKERPAQLRNRSRKQPRTSLRERMRNVPWSIWAFLIVIVFFAVLRFRLREMPLERDEGEYAYAGQLMMQGVPPYQLAYNMKLPGVYAAYAVIMEMFGEDSAGIHIGLLLMNAATAVLVFAIARKLFGLFTAAFAGISYAVSSANPALLGLSAHATHFVVFAACSGILLLLYGVDSGRRRTLFWSGSCLGLAFLMKQPGLVFFLFAVLYLTYAKWTLPLHWRTALIHLGSLSLGVAWPFALTCAVLAWAGVFRKFWFWSIVYARTYASEVPLAVGLGQLRGQVAQILRVGGGIWVVAVAGIFLLFWQAKTRKHWAFICGLLVCSGFGVSAGLYFRSHYFILLLPAVAILAGVAISAAQELLRTRFAKPVLFWVPTAVFALAFVSCLWQARAFLFAPDAYIACKRIYRNNPFIEAQEIGEFLKENSKPDAKIAVFGSEPEIYFYANRHSATGYIYTYGLMENQPFAKTMSDEMISEVSHSNPEFVIFVDDGLSWLWGQGGSQEALLRWLQMFVNTQYIKAAQVDISGNAQHLLGDRARMYIFQRKAQQ